MFRFSGNDRLPFRRLLSLAIVLFLLAGSALAASCQNPSDTTLVTTSSETDAPTTTATPAITTEPAETTTEPAETTEPAPQVLNPLTGEPLSNPAAEGQRPVSIMINNHKAAVPQIGIGSADLIYEMLVEGGITRLMAVFADLSAMPEIGSVRSARHDYIDLSGGLDAIYVHIGASTIANAQFKEQRTPHIDLHAYGDAYWRDPEWREDRGYEHSVKTTGKLLQAAIDKSGYRTTIREGQDTAFNFRSSGEFVPADGDAASAVTVPYSDYCTATFKYDATSHLYSKGQFGRDHIDLATGEPLRFTNIILVMTRVTVVDNIQHKDAELEAGSGYYISGGQWQPITWAKGATEDSFVFKDADGNELLVNPGKSYIGIVPKATKIKFA